MANDLGAPSIADAQAEGQWQTSNDADAVIADALSDVYGGGTGIDFTSGDVTLSATQYRSAMIFKPSAALAASRTLILPGVRRPLWFHNSDATYSVTLKSTDAASPEDADTFIVGPGQIFLGYTDGNSPGLSATISPPTRQRRSTSTCRMMASASGRSASRPAATIRSRRMAAQPNLLPPAQCSPSLRHQLPTPPLTGSKS